MQIGIPAPHPAHKESIKPQHIRLGPPRALAVPAQACFYPFPLF